MNYTELANSYFITMLSDSSISCYHFASSRVWQKLKRSRKCKANRPLLLGLYIVKKNTRACTCHTLQTGLHNQPNMQPNILLLVAFAEINASCSCSLAEDIKKWTVNLKNSIDKPIYFLTNVKTLKWWCFHGRPHIRISEYNSIRVQLISANAKVFRQKIGLSLHLCRGS